MKQALKGLNRKSEEVSIGSKSQNESTTDDHGKLQKKAQLKEFNRKRKTSKSVSK